MELPENQFSDVVMLIRWIKAFIEELDRLGTKIPKENNKNIYLQACWTLSQFNRLEATEGNELVKQAITKVLLILKRECEKDEIIKAAQMN